LGGDVGRRVPGAAGVPTLAPNHHPVDGGVPFDKDGRALVLGGDRPDPHLDHAAELLTFDL